MDLSGHSAEEAATLEKFLRAIEAMADELAARSPEDLTFKVTVREDVPLVGILGALINQIGVDWERHVQEEIILRAHRSKDLALAYEALQAKNDEIQRDLDAARRVQLQLLPQAADIAECREIDFAGHYESKDKVGGDIYDVFRVGQRSWAFLIADVSGHGFPPALLTMFLKAAFRTRSHWGVDADEICRGVNSDLCAVVGDLGLYATAFFGTIDLEMNLLRYVNCGHPPVYFYRRNEGRVIRLDEKGMILGALEEVDLSQSIIGLSRGDILLATSDGIPESKNYLGEMYGQARLLDSFERSARDLGPEARVMDLICSLVAELGIFTLDSPADDDITAAAFRFLGGEGRDEPLAGIEP